jgi:RNA polymerase sigma factor (sigma-70 family)
MDHEDQDSVSASVPAGLLPATHWSVVLQARDQSETALSTLCQDYRTPLLVWLRNRNYSAHDAEDLVQGFFAHLLKRDFLANVSREKGRFRTFLLTSLTHYLRDQHDRQIARKRGAGQPVGSLQETGPEGRSLQDPAGPDNAPDLEYDRAWARTGLANALRRLNEECARSGHSALCAALEPVMFVDETASSYRGIGEKLGMSEGAVKVAAHRLRARLKGLVRDQVLQTVASQEEWEQEVRYLITLFGR